MKGESMTTDTQSELESKLARLAEIKQVMEAGKSLRSEQETLKGEVFELMALSRSKRTEATSGVYAVRVETVKPYIKDPEAVTHWLKMAGYATSDYMKLDTERIATIAKNTLEAGNGEIMPGVEFISTEVLQIRQAKE